MKRWTLALAMACLAGVIGGCAVTSLGLPGGLPQVPGVTSGALSVVTTTLVDAIVGRGYSARIQTTATQQRPLQSCTISGGALPAGMSVAVDPADGTRCRLLANPGALTASGTSSFTLRVVDTNIPSLANTANFTIFVRNEFAGTATALVNGMQGRTYGISPLVQTVSSTARSTAGPDDVSETTEVGNGPITACAVSNITGGALELKPAPPVASTANACRIESSAPFTLFGGFTFTLTFTDSPIPDPVTAGDPTPTNAVPANTISLAGLSLTVVQALAIQVDQLTLGTNPAALLDAVENRSYGVINANAGAPTYTATNGFGAASYRFCVNAGPLPNGFTTTPAISTNCASPTASAGPVLLTAAPAGAASGPTAFTIEVNDAGNAAVPGGSATVSTQLTIFPAITATLTQTQSGNPVTNPATLLDAVEARSYGIVNAGAGAPVYSAANGLGAGTLGTAAYRWCVSAGALPSGFAGTPAISPCATQTTSPTITLSANAAGAAAGPLAFTLQVDDTGNAAVPPGTADSATQITILPPLVSTLAQSTNATPNTKLFDAVTGRSYATGGQSAFAPTYSAAGGLGAGTLGTAAYRWCQLAGPLPSGFVTNPVIADCAAPPPTQTASVTVTTDTAGANQAGPVAPPQAFTLQVDDTGNDAVPAGTDTEATNLEILAGLTLTLMQTQAGNPVTNPATLLDAVESRTYGLIGGTPTYSVTGGTGPGTYVWCVSAGALPAGFVTTPAISTNCGAPTATNGPVTVTSAGAGAAGGPFPFTIQVSDAGSLSPAVPPGGDTKATQLTILPPLTTTFAQGPNTNPNSTMLDGVAGRSYGQIGGGAGAIKYTASGGLGSGTAGPSNYGWCSTLTAGPNTLAQMGFTTIGTNCVTFTTTGSAVQLDSPSAVAGSGSFRVDVTDQANDATPSATISHGNSTLTILNVFSLDVTQAGNPTPTNPANLLDAVEARNYATGGQAAAAPTWIVTGGLGSGTAGVTNYEWCRTTGLPNNFAESIPVSTNCAARTTGIASTALFATPAGTAAPAFTITYEVEDAGNLATPSASVAAGGPIVRSSDLTILAPLNASFDQNGNANPSGALLPAVHGRTYGIINANAGAPTYTASGGLGSGTGGPTSYRWCTQPVAGTPVNAMGFTSIDTTCGAGSTTSGVTALLTASPASSTGGPNAADTGDFRVELSDSGNPAVAAATVLIPSIGGPPSTMNVNPVLAITDVSGLGSPYPAAVLGRTYGNPGAGFTPIVFQAVGGLGSNTVDGSFIFTPNGLGLVAPGNGFPAAINCQTGLGVNGLAHTEVCTTRLNTITAATGNYNTSMTVDDLGNAATPSASAASVAPSTPVVVLPVNPDPTIVVNVVVGASDPPPPGVSGRTYGNTAASTCGALGNAQCRALVYDASGGTGTYNFTLPPSVNNPAANGVPNPVACSVSLGTRVTCTSGTSVITGAPGNYQFTVDVTDVASATTPGGGVGSSGAKAILVNSALFLALDGSGLASPLPDGVVSRGYGLTGQGKTPIVYSVTDGLGSPTVNGSYTFNPTLGATTPGAGFPSGITCTTGTNPNANRSTCSGTIGSVGTGVYNTTITASDVANESTPAGTSNSVVENLNVVAGLTLTRTPAGTNPPGAVQGQTYGDPASTCPGSVPCVPVEYTAAGGIAPQNFGAMPTTINTPGAGVPDPVACTALALVVTCTTGANPITAGTGAYNYSISVTDGSNNAVAPATQTLNETITVGGALALSTPTPDPATNPAVSGRTYGDSASDCKVTPGPAVPCQAPTFTASGGTGSYSYNITGTNPSTRNITCASASATTFDCKTVATTVSGAATTLNFTVELGDAGNASVPEVLPSGSGVSQATSIEIKDPLANLTPATFVNGLRNFPYQSPSGVQFDVDGGLGNGTPTNYKWSQPGAVAGVVCTAPSGSLPTGLGIGGSTGVLSGTPTAASTSAADFTFRVCVEDVANATTPPDSLTASADMVINILDQKGYVVSSTAARIEKISTNVTTGTATSSSIALTAGDSVRDVAISPDGTKAYVLVQNSGAGIVRVVETFGDTVSTSFTLADTGGSPSATCTNPQRIAMGKVGATQRAYVTCNNRDLFVLDVDGNAVIDGIPNLGSGTTAFEAIAFDESTDNVLAFDPVNRVLHVRNSSLGAVTTLDLSATITVAPAAGRGNLVVKADGSQAFIIDTNANLVRIIDTPGSTPALNATTMNPTAAGLQNLAITPNDGFLYVTLDSGAAPNDSKFAVFELVTFGLVGSSPIALADADDPRGVAIPPLGTCPPTAVGTCQAYIVANAANAVRVHDDNGTTFPVNATRASIALTAATSGTRIKAMHVPF